jgi:C1A family cysteine protease
MLGVQPQKKRLKLPPLVDLRGFCPPVYDQGSLASCTAQAAAFTYEFSEIEEKHRFGVPSRLQIYWSVRKLQGTVNQDSGATIRGVFKAIAKDGYSRDKLWPYNIKKFKQQPPKPVMDDAATRKPNAKQYVRVPHDAELMKAVLAQSNPIAFGFSVPKSFMDGPIAKTGIMRMPSKTEKITGGHAVALVGYDDMSQHWLVRNSWGEKWGRAGYFFMPYDFLKDPNWCSDFWTVLDAPG